MKKILFLLSITLLYLTACKKLPDGFLSPTVRYEESPILIIKGRVSVSSALNFDGSSIPASVKLLHVYDETGNNVDDIFMKTYPTTTWTSAYNNLTDTTEELIAAKQTTTDLPPIFINEKSGAVESNFNTVNIPEGTYSFDLEMSNGAGTKTYEKVGLMEITEGAFAESPDAPYNRMYKVGDETKTSLAGKPTVTIERTGDAPNVISLKILDKNGVPFNPAAGEIIQRPNSGVNPNPKYLQTLQDYALKTTLLDDHMEFIYGTLPFPLVSKGNGFNIYYRVPAQYFIADDQATYPEGQWSSNPRFSLRIYVQGSYTITYQYPDMTHK